MDWLTPVAALMGGLLGGGGIAALLRIRHDKRIGVRSQELAEAQHHETAQDRLVQRLETRVVAMEKRIETLEAKRRDDQKVIRSQGDHIDQLEHHIWTRKPPPPPARPVTA